MRSEVDISYKSKVRKENQQRTEPEFSQGKDPYTNQNSLDDTYINQKAVKLPLLVESD